MNTRRRVLSFFLIDLIDYEREKQHVLHLIIIVNGRM
jgi:hypothetical protein